jgi:cellulose synthase (UDP-forming)
MVLEAHRPDALPAPPVDEEIIGRPLLPDPPSDREKYLYVGRELPLLMTTSVLSVCMVTVSQVHFISLAWWLLALAPFLAFTMAYFLISLRINITSRNFDLRAHKSLVAGWNPPEFPDVDILLPICNEPLSVLHNSWTHVERLARTYKGTVDVLVLDDGDDPDAAAQAARFGFRYTVRPNRGWFKKAGNLRHGYHNSSSTFIVIFDADFAPRTDFLDELLPYMDRDPTLGIVQSPQYFRVDPRQNWLERGAGAVQELFYRVVQVSRDRLNGAICVGSCAVYRRKALDAIGGTTLIGHSEDVHTGFDLARAGWGLRYVPLPLATGLCPDDSDSFLVQQYRWCSGSMSLLGSSKFWRTKLGFSTRLCYLSGFCYYLHTAVFTFVTPLIPIVLIVGIPGQVHVRNYLWILPSTMYNFIIFPLWNRARFGPGALVAKSLYGWAHVFAVWDILRNKRMGWQATGGGGKKSTQRMWRAVAWWGVTASVVWVGVCAVRMVQYDPLSFLFVMFAGLVYAGVVTMGLLSRRPGGAQLGPRRLISRVVASSRRPHVEAAVAE